MAPQILTPIDFSRHAGVLDHALLAGTHLACIGLGGAAGLVQSLTRAGIRQWTLIDYDRVALTNPATQAHDYADRGKLKCEALAERLLRIDPNAHVRTLAKRYQDLTPDECDQLWAADCALAMTDNFQVQSLINTDAVAAGRPAIFANCYIGCGAVEVNGQLSRDHRQRRRLPRLPHQTALRRLRVGFREPYRHLQPCPCRRLPQCAHRQHRARLPTRASRVEPPHRRTRPRVLAAAVPDRAHFPELRRRTRRGLRRCRTPAVQLITLAARHSEHLAMPGLRHARPNPHPRFSMPQVHSRYGRNSRKELTHAWSRPAWRSTRSSHRPLAADPGDAC